MSGGIHPPTSALLEWISTAGAHEHKRWDLVIITCVLSSFAILAALTCLWARQKEQGKVQNHEFSVYISLILILGLGILTSIGRKHQDVKYGSKLGNNSVIRVRLDRHSEESYLTFLASRTRGFDQRIWDLTSTELSTNRKICFAIEILYIVATGLTKISILLFYLRLIQSVTAAILIVKVTITLIAASTIAFSLATVFSCSPFVAIWQQINPTWRENHNWRCIDEAHTYLAASATGMILDFITWSLPLFMMSKLRSSRGEQVVIAGIFAIGFLACGASVLRVYYVWRLHYRTSDFTGEANYLWIWMVVEINLGSICASAPAIISVTRHCLRGRGLNSKASKKSISNGYPSDSVNETDTPSNDTIDTFSTPNLMITAGTKLDHKPALRSPSSDHIQGAESVPTVTTMTIGTTVIQENYTHADAESASRVELGIPRLPEKSRKRDTWSAEASMRLYEDRKHEPAVPIEDFSMWPTSISSNLDPGWSWHGQSLLTIMEEDDLASIRSRPL